MTRRPRPVNNGEAHPGHPHPLTPIQGTAPFWCGSCKSWGRGYSYYCCLCQIHFHSTCASSSVPVTFQPFISNNVLAIICPPAFPTGLFCCDRCVNCNHGTCYPCHIATFESHVHQVHKDIPRTQHPSHSAHELVFCPLPANCDEFTCNGCGHEGRGSSYRCPECDFDLHLLCAELPHLIVLSQRVHSCPGRVMRRDEYPGPHNNDICCDICNKGISANNWLYRCDRCDFDFHLDCAINHTY